MKFLIVLPDHSYYLWQMLVQINNLKKFGYDKDTIYLIGKTGYNKSDNLKNIIRKSNTGCVFYVYDDDRKDFTYSPAMTAHIISKFLKENPKFEKETFFYIDPDVIFRKKIRFSDLLNNDIWYVSDTRSYIGSSYIKSKGNELFEKMCDVVGISTKVVENNDNNAGGAQLLIKNTNHIFWDKVKKDSIKLFKLMEDTKSEYCPEAPIQSWTAEMWSLLWNSWLFNHKTKIIKRFDFCWSTDIISKWDKTNILHNAGVINDNNGELFAKTKYQISPFKKKIKYSDKYCSSKYVNEIKETEKNFKNLLF